METLPNILQQLCSSEDTGIADLESILGDQIAAKSGAKRSEILERPAIVVKPITLNAREIGGSLDSAVAWIARRIKDTGKGVFDITVTRQPTRIVLIAQWSRRSENPPVHAHQPGAASVRSGNFNRRSFARLTTS